MRVIVFCVLICISAFARSEMNQSVTYKVATQEYEGYLIYKNKNRPLVFLIHDWDGLTDYEIRRANMLYEEGYNVFALDLFGKGVRPTKVEDKRQHTGALYADRDKMRSIIVSAYEYSKSLGFSVENSVAIGYCFGGAAVLEWARSPLQLKGYISIHGGLTTPAGQNYSTTQGELLILHGAADDHIPMSEFAALANQLEASKVSHEMIAYGGAPHAFTVFGSGRYRKLADQRSWARIQAFLEAVIDD